MSRQTFRIGTLALAAMLLASSAGAINRVSKSLGVLEIHGGYSSPTGKIDHVSNNDFYDEGVLYNVPTKDVFKSSFTMGFSLGLVKKSHWYTTVGLDYTHMRIKDTIFFPNGSGFILSPKPNFNHFDLRLNANYQFSDIELASFTPYLGLGVGAGLTTQSLRGYASETEINIGLALNFGAEAKLWQDASGRTLVTLASANSWEFFGSGYRPKFLTIGAAIKFYSRM
jgi:opacity protein-like surface antigen